MKYRVTIDIDNITDAYNIMEWVCEQYRSVHVTLQSAPKYIPPLDTVEKGRL